MRILLTGASGFVGRQVLAALPSSDVEVHAVSSRRPAPDAKVTWHQADLLTDGTAEALVKTTRPDCILHLAWYVEPGLFWTDPSNLDWTAATMRLASAAAESGVRRFVGVGTCYEYDWPAASPCVEEHTPLASHTLYDTSKDACRRVLAARFTGEETSFAWGRLFFLYGPHEAANRLVSSVARNLITGRDAPCSRGTAFRDFMDVRDAGAALAALALSKVEGAVNIGTGEGHNIADIARRLGELSGRPELVRIGALPDRQGEPPFIVADANRLGTEVGFKSSRSLDEGLSDALGFWRTHVENGATR
ncbi:NAD-dependent epimerase/dehydratase family protein [Parvibaculum sp.]|uniref:NAD-dependent epimerase/dehydratase family protein n=1 Tax=Parvibaculum sp. TaxID=2024848 RepID=UPI003BA91A92